MRKKSSFLNFQFSNSKDADLNIRILEHTITKYTGAKDRNFFAATGTIDYEISMQISKLGKSEEFNFRSSEIFPYDTNKILSNEKKMEDLEVMFFFEAQNQLKNFLYLYFYEKKNIFLIHGPEDFLIELERNRLVFELKKNGYEERKIFFLNLLFLMKN